MTETPVVFLHGWGPNCGIWTETRAGLANASAPDLPGYDGSPMPTPYDAHRLAEAVAARLPDNAIVVGWSMGGMVALALAERRPLRGLVLVGTSPAFVQRPDWPHAMTPELLAEFAHSLANDYRDTLLRFFALQARGGEAAREVTARLRRSLLERDPPSPAVLAAGLELLRDADLRKEASAITCPTLVVHGGRDTLCPPAAGEWLARHIPHAHLAMEPKAAHAPFLSHPEWFAGRLKEFIDEHA